MPGLESSLHWSCIWIDWKDKDSSRYLLVQKDDLFSNEIPISCKSLKCTYPTMISSELFSEYHRKLVTFRFKFV